MRKKWLPILVFLFCAGEIEAQTTKSIQYNNQVWLGYFNQTRFSKHWGSWTDIQLRTKENFFDNLNQSLVRVGLTNYLTDNTKLTLGYTWVNNFPGDNHPDVSQPEHRIWQQVQWHTKYPRLRLMQWLRLEERWQHKVDAATGLLADGFDFKWRLRYNFLFNVPLGAKAFTPGSISFVLNDEIHVNFGSNVVYNYFDQNRFFVGFNYHVNAADNIQFGYMNQFQQLAAGNRYKSNDVARIFYFHNLDLRRKTNTR